MPRGTKVHSIYDALREKGLSAGKAARIAQSRTGLALQTGKPPKYHKNRGMAGARKNRKD